MNLYCSKAAGNAQQFISHNFCSYCTGNNDNVNQFMANIMRVDADGAERRCCRRARRAR